MGAMQTPRATELPMNREQPKETNEGKETFFRFFPQDEIGGLVAEFLPA
jgi:hypothetical protein